MGKLTKAYLNNHKGYTHTFDSFARTLFDQLLDEAEKKVAQSEVERVDLTVNFQVSAFEPLGCITICAERPDGTWWCIHQQTQDPQKK